MIKPFLLLAVLAFLGGCSTTVSKRDVASAEEHTEEAHRGFIGNFDRH